MSYISEGNGPALVASGVIPIVLTWAFSSVRIYVRWFMLRVWKVEDWLFIASQISFSVLAFNGLMSAVHGNGQLLGNISASDIPVAMQYWYAAELSYTTTTILIRLSIGFFLLRICTSKPHIWIIRTSMLLMSLITTTYFFFIIFQCHPISYFWLQFSGSKGTCIAGQIVEDATIVFSVFAALTDLIFGILPVFVIWNLQMNRKTKTIVGGLLTLGVLAGLSVVIRIYYVHEVDPDAEFLYTTSKVSIWSMIEPAVGICCMATATYRPLFKSLLDKTSLTTHARSRAATYNAFDGPNSGAGASGGGANGHGTKSSLSRSKIGSMKSTHTKNSDSFDFEMKMDTYETTVEGPGKGKGFMGRSKSKGKGKGKDGNGSEGVGIGDGILQSTTVEVRRVTRCEDV